MLAPWKKGYGKPAAAVASVVSDSVRPHRRQPTRLPRPWDSQGKNTGVGCHFLLQCMKVKSESEVTQLCPTLSDSMDCSPPGSCVHGIFQARELEWGAITFSKEPYTEGWLWIIYGFSVASRVGTTTPELFKGRLQSLKFFYLPLLELQGNSDCSIHFCVTPHMLPSSFSHHFILYSSFSLDIAPLTRLKTFVSLLIFLQLQVNFDGLYV